MSNRNARDQLLARLKCEFPLIEQVMLQKEQAGAPERLLPFLALIQRAIPEGTEPPRCFVLPRKQNMPILIAILFGMQRFQNEFEKLTTEYAKKSFSMGQRVLVLPTRHVYTFEGIWLEYGGTIFRLGELGTRDARSFPINEVLRLEPTDRVRPKGKLNTRLGKAPLSPIDKLLRVSTLGNKSLFHNEVLYLDYINTFEDFIKEFYFQGTPALSWMPPIAELLPFGSISEGGQIKRWDDTASQCEPLIAVVSSPSSMANACNNFSSKSRLVIINGFHLISRNLQAYDEICSSQNVVIIAEHQEQEHFKTFSDRGCNFWVFENEDVLIGLDTESLRAESTANIFKPVLQSSVNRTEISIECCKCENPLLEKVASLLEGIQSQIVDDTNENVVKLIEKCFGLLMYAADLVDRLEESSNKDLQHRMNGYLWELGRLEVFVKPEFFSTLKDALRLLEDYFSEPGAGQIKALKIRNVLIELSQKGSKSIGLLARNLNTLEFGERVGIELGLKIRTFTPRTIPEDDFFDAVVCTVWPGSIPFRRLSRLYLTSRIILVGFSFEAFWLRQCEQHLKKRFDFSMIDAKEKAKWVGWTQEDKLPWLDKDIKESQILLPGEEERLHIWKLEERLRKDKKRIFDAETIEEKVFARYIGFMGSAYAYLTETRRWPVITDLVRARGSAIRRVPLRTVNEMVVDDFVVFRDGGKREVLEVLADIIIGEQASAFRERANYWQKALVRSRLAVNEIKYGLESRGILKHHVTIRWWLESETIIGPESIDDLRAISDLISDPELNTKLDEIWKAIEYIRSAHLSAGMRLTKILIEQLPKNMGSMGEEGAKIDIDGAITASVVQVEEIEEKFESCPRKIVNRLLWSDLDHEDLPLFDWARTVHQKMELNGTK
jgi:hypothetical protein